jgi:hypothetical protein
MSNPMKYIKDLEAAGFQRAQAEAQVQMVLEVLEGDLVTKSEFALFKEHVDRRFVEVSHQFRELELTLTVRLGLITVTTTTIAVAVLSWLIKLH